MLNPALADVLGENLCIQRPGIQYCFHYRIEFKSDLTFQGTFDEFTISSTCVLTEESTWSPSGTFVFQDNKVTLIEDDNETHSGLSFNEDQLIWRYGGDLGDFGPNCIQIEEYSLLE